MAKIDIPVQVNIPVEEVIEYLKKGGTLVEVVRCRECKYWRYDDCQNDSHGYCPINENDFCSRGERKEQNDG